jgi:hypothetical protein
MTPSEWKPINTAPEGVEVETVIADGSNPLLSMRNQTTLVRKGRLWFFPDMSMYIYYQPTHWRRL